ncbi:unnamed protein product, partial [Vitis vinifera]
MIRGKDIYDVLAAIVPLYVAMILAYGSVRWWKIFTPEQCAGINRFVAVFAVPLLSFHFISLNDIYNMNYNSSLRRQAPSHLSGLNLMASSFNQTDFYAMFASKTASPRHGSIGGVGAGGGADVFSLQSMSGELFHGGLLSSYPPPNPMFSGSTSGGPKKKESGGGGAMPNKELHMFVWSSSASPVSEGNLRHTVNRAESADFGVIDSSKAVLQQEIAASRGMLDFNDTISPRVNGDREADMEDGSIRTQAAGTPYSGQKKADMQAKKQQMPPTSVMTRLIMIMVWRKLIRNPNTYASLIGLIWSLVSFRWNIKMPTIVSGSISILSDAGLGMAMFSLGLFMALQPKMIACGKTVATFSMAVRFLTGPAVIAATSIAIGMRGVLLHVAIVQAALPQGIVPFVFAKEYNVHADILSTAVIFGMLIALPITIIYYVLLGL